ncbi:S8 family serine peptidase [Actinoallomurus iriomotensis]|uniref:Peptidase S8 n=1 Tax=Actinoallomurus iriomotensis TaxID=478107 RepID=A0A9W6RDU8_9ACTN|nr:S8 family serine peptidase [Actinoallomurus iriomotensis]GLY73784.1 peptidase S8 [Actinoallomurus iriomotensis]
MRSRGALRDLVTRAAAWAGAVTTLTASIGLTPAAATPGPASLPGVSQTVSGGTSGCLKPSTAESVRVPWPQTYLRPENVWPLTQGAGVRVAVVGSGVDDGSGLLGTRLTLGPRLYGHGDAGRDCVGHGTFIAGLIAARRRAGVGFAGIAPQAEVLSVAVTDDIGVTTPGLLAKGIRAAADAGSDVIDVAVPVTAGSPALASAVGHANAHGALVVAPAAADGHPGGPVYPAAYRDVLAVSDIGPNGLPPQSAASGGRVDLSAPGDAVMSVGPGGPGDFTGTGPSYAAALVAGTAALTLAYRPRMSPAELRSRLEITAYHPGTTMPDPRLGYGTVDPASAVGMALPEQAGAAARSTGPRPVPAMPPPRPRQGNAPAYRVAAGAAAAIALVGFGAVVIPRGRRRGWRPSMRRPDPPA